MKKIDFYKKAPSAIITDVLTAIENRMDGNSIGNEHTTPFHMLLESSVSLSSDSLIGAENIIRKKFSTLAVKESDLYHHITDEEISNMFAVPGETNLIFNLNVLDMKQFGHRKNGAVYIETTIPTNTKIIVKNTVFTLLNDIVVRYYDNGTVAVEQINSSMDIAVNDIGVLFSNISTDKEAVSWITFETKVKNIEVVEKLLPVTPSKVLTTTIPLTNKFVGCYVTMLGSNGETNLNITYSDEYINPKVPTAYISLTSTSVTVTIPEVYVLEGMVEGKLKISVYETKGNFYLPINKFPSTDFVIEIGDDGKSESSATVTNITTVMESKDILSGGVDNMSFEELRKSVILNTTGDIDLPITEQQLKRKASMYNYNLYKASNTLTMRTYIASKDLEMSTNNLILANQEVFFNNVGVDLSIDGDKSNVVVSENNFTIKANTVFIVINDRVEICTDETMEYIDSLSRLDRVEYFKNNKLFYTPYEYVIMQDETITTSEIYYFEPSMDNMRIVTKNTNIAPTTNTYQYLIQKVNDGYEIYTNILANDELSKTDLTKLKARIVIPLKNSNGLNIYFDSVYDTTTKMFKFYIDAEFISNEGILINNGISLIHNNNIDILTKATIYLYTTDPTLSDSTSYLLDELDNPNDWDITILTKETIEIKFGEKIDYLYNNVYNTYTDRKYKLHTESVPLYYTHNVYEENPEDSTITKAVTKADGRVGLYAKLLHSAGDPVLDENGEQVYKYQINTPVMVDGERVIERKAGVMRYINILMLDYKFMVAESTPYKNYRELLMDSVNKIVINDMNTLNNITLENTIIYYKSSKTIDKVAVSVNNVNYLLDNEVKPAVKLYILNTATVTSEEMESYKDTCGRIISKHLSNDVIVLRDIKDEIIKTLGSSISAISLTNIDPNSSEILKVTSVNRFTHAKYLAFNKANEYIVRYYMDFDVEYV